MTEQISPLRQRMLDDMKIRNMALSTQYIYLRAVARFSLYHGCSPDKLGIEDARDYRLHLISRGLKTAPCPCCGGRMRVIETFERGTTPHSTVVIRLDTS